MEKSYTKISSHPVGGYFHDTVGHVSCPKQLIFVYCTGNEISICLDLELKVINEVLGAGLLIVKVHFYSVFDFLKSRSLCSQQYFPLASKEDSYCWLDVE